MSRTAIVPDVMLGIVEVLRLITDRGDPVIVNSRYMRRSTLSCRMTAAE